MAVENPNGKRILEIIPVNPSYQPPDQIAGAHFGRVSASSTPPAPVDKVILLSFDMASKTQGFNNLVNALSLLPYGAQETREFSLQYPAIFQQIKELRIYIEMNFVNHEVFLNLTTFTHHFHAILFRDGLQSSKYNYYPYEILNPSWRKFNSVLVPNYFGLDMIDWEIIAELSKGVERELSIKEFQELLDLPGWNKHIKTIDQKLRLKLNNLVFQGLIDVVPRANGEKFFFLKRFAM